MASIFSSFRRATHMDQQLWDYLVTTVPSTHLTYLLAPPPHVSQHVTVQRLLSELQTIKDKYINPPNLGGHMFVDMALLQAAEALIKIGAQEIGHILPKIGRILPLDLCASIIQEITYTHNSERHVEFFITLLPTALELLLPDTALRAFMDSMFALSNTHTAPSFPKPEVFLASIASAIQALAEESRILFCDRLCMDVSSLFREAKNLNMAPAGPFSKDKIDLFFAIALSDVEAWLRFLSLASAPSILENLPAEIWANIPRDYLVKGLAKGPGPVKSQLFKHLSQLKTVRI